MKGSCMKLHDCLNYVGLPSTDSSIKDLLLQLGCKKEPKCKKDDPDFFWSSEQYCVELLFTDEDYLKNNDEPTKYGLAPLILSAIHIYLIGNSENYPNNFVELPVGLDFGESREVVLKTLGPSKKSFESNGKVRNDQWIFDDCRLLAAYDQDTNLKRISAITSKYD
jgi:hypothetical protein